MVGKWLAFKKEFKNQTNLPEAMTKNCKKITHLKRLKYLQNEESHKKVYMEDSVLLICDFFFYDIVCMLPSIPSTDPSPSYNMFSVHLYTVKTLI